jgi:hypothetical protein
MSDTTVNSIGNDYQHSESHSYDDGGDNANNNQNFQNGTQNFGQDENQGFDNFDPNNIDPNQAQEDFQQQWSNPADQGFTPSPGEKTNATGQEECTGEQTNQNATGNPNENTMSPEDMAAKMLAQMLGISEEEAKQMLSGKEETVPATQDQNATFA